MRAHNLRHNKLISGLVEEGDSVCPRHEGASIIVAAGSHRQGVLYFHSVLLLQHGLTTQNFCQIFVQIPPHEASYQMIPEMLDLAPSLPCSQDGQMAVPVAQQTGNDQKPQTT
jgi:hypothetical protein